MESPLVKYNFRDDQGHPLENCVEYITLLAALDRAQREVKSLDALCAATESNLVKEVKGKIALRAENARLTRALENVTSQERERYADALIAMSNDNRRLRAFILTVAESTMCNLAQEAFQLLEKETPHAS